ISLILHFGGWTPPIIQVVFYMALLAIGGTPFLAVAVLISCVVKGEYTAPLVNFAIVIWVIFSFGAKKLLPYNPLTFMQGAAYLDRRTSLLVGPFPWLHLTLSVIVALMLVTLSVIAIQKLDF